LGLFTGQMLGLEVPSQQVFRTH